MISMMRLGQLVTAALAAAAASLLIPAEAHAAIPAWWCTSIPHQRLNGDVNGDGRIDAVCHDRVNGAKWVALAESTGLEERWHTTTNPLCIHAGAQLHIGDVNGDRRADLVCKDPGRVWVDYAGADFYAGTDYHLDTSWCSHAGARTFVGDQNRDGRADLVCRGSDGWVWIDHADPLGRFAASDVWGQGPDFELLDIIDTRSGTYQLVIRNNGLAGQTEIYYCSSARQFANVLRFDAGATRSIWIPYQSTPRETTCTVEGRGDTGRELFISNNQLTRTVR